MPKDVLGLVFQLRKYVGHCYREVKSISDPIWLPYRYGFTSGDLSSSSKFCLKWKEVRKYVVSTYLRKGARNTKEEKMYRLHLLTLRFFLKFVSRAYCSKIHQPNESPRKQKM